MEIKFSSNFHIFRSTSSICYSWFNPVNYFPLVTVSLCFIFSPSTIQLFVFKLCWWFFSVFKLYALESPKTQPLDLLSFLSITIQHITPSSPMALFVMHMLINSKYVFLSHPYLSSNFLTHIWNCFIDISTWMSSRYLKLGMKTKILLHSKPVHPYIFSFSETGTTIHLVSNTSTHTEIYIHTYQHVFGIILDFSY